MIWVASKLKGVKCRMESANNVVLYQSLKDLHHYEGEYHGAVIVNMSDCGFLGIGLLAAVLNQEDDVILVTGT